MPLIDKEKTMQGIDKAVDVINEKADKAARYCKEKEVDKKIDTAVQVIEKTANDVINEVKKTFGK